MEALRVPELACGRVALRGWRCSDLPRVVEAYADPALRRTARRPVSDADGAAAWLARWEARRRSGEGLAWAVTAAGPPLGCVSLTALDHEHAQAAIGYWAHPEGRGRGLITAAVRLVSRWAFAELGLARLELLTDAGNAASLRVAQRCGFVPEGRLRSRLLLAEGRCDAIVHGLLPPDLTG